jgi:hypothetical protein
MMDEVKVFTIGFALVLQRTSQDRDTQGLIYFKNSNLSTKRTQGMRVFLGVCVIRHITQCM